MTQSFQAFSETQEKFCSGKTAEMHKFVVSRRPKLATALDNSGNAAKMFHTFGDSIS